MKKTIFISVVLVLLFSLNTNAQNIKYNDVKNSYTTQGYRSVIKHEIYSPLAAGLSSYFLPGLGQFYLHEPLRGICFMGSELVAAGVAFAGFINIIGEPIDDFNDHYNKRWGGTLLITGMIAGIIIEIWSICDAVKIAKIKNLALQKDPISIQINPEINFSNSTLGNYPCASYGLSLNIRL